MGVLCWVCRLVCADTADDFNRRINEVRMDTVADVLVALIDNRRMLLVQDAQKHTRDMLSRRQ